MFSIKCLYQFGKICVPISARNCEEDREGRRRSREQEVTIPFLPLPPSYSPSSFPLPFPHIGLKGGRGEERGNGDSFRLPFSFFGYFLSAPNKQRNSFVHVYSLGEIFSFVKPVGKKDLFFGTTLCRLLLAKSEKGAAPLPPAVVMAKWRQGMFKGEERRRERRWIGRKSRWESPLLSWPNAKITLSFLLLLLSFFSPLPFPKAFPPSPFSYPRLLHFVCLFVTPYISALCCSQEKN